MEIKSDPASAVQDASLMSGPTYITVHTADGEVMVDGEVTHSDGQAELTEGQLQHVVMQAEGMTEPMVIQVIRDLTGGATVYQQVETAGQTMVSTAQQHEVVEQEAVVTATTAATGVQRHIVVTSPRTQQSVQAESSSIVYRTT
ncbi:hypothetical protein BaRGS_00027437 [Batillaria attramentaria]|uniref:Uncharacterized protein n=1 Tax=Batillaria attramentaria TaxID=370345 RepID=A0ABD0K1U4_9CAEN